MDGIPPRPVSMRIPGLNMVMVGMGESPSPYKAVIICWAGKGVKKMIRFGYRVSNKL